VAKIKIIELYEFYVADTCRLRNISGIFIYLCRVEEKKKINTIVQDNISFYGKSKSSFFCGYIDQRL
jgi:hypothetical protein